MITFIFLVIRHSSILVGGNKRPMIFRNYGGVVKMDVFLFMQSKARSLSIQT